MPEYLTPREVGELLRVAEKTVYRLVSSDPTLPVLRLTPAKNATLRFPRERLLKWLRDREQGRSAHRQHNGALSSPKSAPDRARASDYSSEEAR